MCVCERERLIDMSRLMNKEQRINNVVKNNIISISNNFYKFLTLCNRGGLKGDVDGAKLEAGGLRLGVF
jgi:hypothetical protein